MNFNNSTMDFDNSTSRRSFLGSLLATSVLAPVSTVASEVASRGNVRLRLGLLSDIHIEGPNAKSVGKFHRALQYFDRRKADAVLISGDLADNGVEPQLQRMMDVWKEVFPNDRRSDGQPIVRLFHYGDHDTGGYAHKDSFQKAATNLKRLYKVGDEQIEKWAICNDRAAIWERVTGEKFEPITFKTVKGYDFILAHWTKLGEGNKPSGCVTPGLEEFFASHARTGSGKPFFYSQHRIPRNTACGPRMWGQDAGRDNAVFARYPNLMVFCGHGHRNAFCDNSLWQGEFTCVQTPSLNYVAHEDTEDHPFGPKVKCDTAEQGLFLTVYDKSMVLERIDLRDGLPLGKPWTMAIAPDGTIERKYTNDQRIRAAVAPQFKPGATMRMHRDDPGKRLHIRFPSAPAREGVPRAIRYDVQLDFFHYCGGGLSHLGFSAYSPMCFAAAEKDDCEVHCEIPYEKLLSEGKMPKVYHVTVRPCGGDGERGLPLECQIGSWYD